MSVTASVCTKGLALEPLDTLFFRDGRPFDAGVQAVSGMPMPQTFAGAVRTWLLQEAGCDLDRLGDCMKAGATFEEALADGQPSEVQRVAELRFGGPWFRTDEEPVVPLPANLLWVEKSRRFIRLDPLPPDVSVPGWRPSEDGLRPLWPRDPEPASRRTGFLKLSGLRAYLEGGVPAHEDFRSPQDLFGHDRRIGVGIDAGSLTAREGFIYSVSLLSLKSGVSLYGEVSGPPDLLERLPEKPTPIRLGGESRRVAMRRIPQVDWRPDSPPSGRRLLLLTTPGLFDGGWKPNALSPVAAAVPGYQAVSGWDLARIGPKPTRFAAAAGSVYFLDEKTDPLPTTLCAADDATVGWGCYLEGVWDYA